MASVYLPSHALHPQFPYLSIQVGVDQENSGGMIGSELSMNEHFFPLWLLLKQHNGETIYMVTTH